LDEGFGMPVLDAMARGVPVLNSNGSAMPEVAGEAGHLVDPHDVASIAEGLRRLIGDTALREQLTRAGLARVQQFSWEKSVGATWNVYLELLGRAT
jgi:glycosyltransferase involved in cell wall biosynthesis